MLGSVSLGRRAMGRNSITDGLSVCYLFSGLTLMKGVIIVHIKKTINVPVHKHADEARRVGARREEYAHAV